MCAIWPIAFGKQLVTWRFWAQFRFSSFKLSRYHSNCKISRLYCIIITLQAVMYFSGKLKGLSFSASLAPGTNILKGLRVEEVVSSSLAQLYSLWYLCLMVSTTNFNQIITLESLLFINLATMCHEIPVWLNATGNNECFS